MSMCRIYCPNCQWTTRPHYSIIGCIMEKEVAHRHYGVNSFDAHDFAFDKECPKCGEITKQEDRYFPDSEIKAIKDKIANGPNWEQLSVGYK